MFWVYACDLADALIGPFATRKEAADHIQFCVDRGDAATMEVWTDEQRMFRENLDGPPGMTLTPEEDKAYGRSE